MQCGVYLRRLWTSKHVSTIGALEASYYLIQPWLQLIGTLVYPVPGLVFLANYAAGPEAMQNWVRSGGWMVLIFYLVAGLGPFVLWGPLYLRRCEPQLGILRATGLGFGIRTALLGRSATYTLNAESTANAYGLPKRALVPGPPSPE